MIEVSNLSKLYWTGLIEVKALQDVSIMIGDGEYVSIMGPSGSGKSTLMNLLGCLDTPSSGSYRLDGPGENGPKFLGVGNKNHLFGFCTFHGHFIL